MASDSDTLSLGSLRRGLENRVKDAHAPHHAPVHAPAPTAAPAPPLHPADPVNHPQAAAAARERIANLPQPGILPPPDTIPAAPTANLVTDRATLAKQATQAHLAARPKIPSALRPVMTAVGVFLLVLLLFKAPILLSQLGYSFGQKNNSTTNSAPAVTTDAVPAANTITISKINVHAPVVYEPSVQEADVQKALENGVVHYGNTPVPGQSGNVAIFGHSSNDWWEPGNYKFVFVLLDKLAPGDQVTIDYNQVRYTYQVTGSQIVDPTDVAVLSPTSTPTLTLITCSPPGTSLRRLVVTAKQISPDPTKATTSTQTASNKSGSSSSNLPSSAPSFFTQVQQAWNGVVQGFESVFGSGSNSNSGTSPSPSSSSSPNQLPAIK